jgi:hypothetical protein
MKEPFYRLDMDEAAEVFEQEVGRPPTEAELDRMKQVFGNVMADGRIAEHMRLAAQEVAGV